MAASTIVVQDINGDEHTLGTRTVGGIEYPVETNFGYETSPKNTVTTIGTSAAAVVSAPTTDRRSLAIKASPNNTAIIYIGASNVTADETATGGWPLTPGEGIAFDQGAGIVYAISTATGQKIIVLEFA